MNCPCCNHPWCDLDHGSLKYDPDFDCSCCGYPNKCGHKHPITIIKVSSLEERINALEERVRTLEQ